MIVDTAHGSRVVPPQEAVWQCRVVGVGMLLRSLLLEAVDLSPDYERGSRAQQIMLLLLTEIRSAPDLKLGIPFPADARLARHCRFFLSAPTSRTTINACGTLGMSRRAFTRLFRNATGLSFAAWRQKARILAAVPRLAAGQPVTTIALDLGYATTGAFSTMFKQTLGIAPSVHRRRRS